MLNETNLTSSASVEDYTKTLAALSDASLAESANTNHWCWKSLQQTDIDYHRRYLACVTLQLQRGHRDNF